jgi:hypothetical protein
MLMIPWDVLDRGLCYRDIVSVLAEGLSKYVASETLHQS